MCLSPNAWFVFIIINGMLLLTEKMRNFIMSSGNLLSLAQWIIGFITKNLLKCSLLDVVIVVGVFSSSSVPPPLYFSLLNRKWMSRVKGEPNWSVLWNKTFIQIKWPFLSLLYIHSYTIFIPKDLLLFLNGSMHFIWNWREEKM